MFDEIEVMRVLVRIIRNRKALTGRAAVRLAQRIMAERQSKEQLEMYSVAIAVARTRLA